MRREHVFLQPEHDVSVGLARVFTPFLVAAPLFVGALLVVLAWQTGGWRPAALAVVLVGGTAPYNLILVRSALRRSVRSR